VRQAAPLALAAELTAYPILLGATLLFMHRGALSYEATFQPYEALAQQLAAQSCGRAAALGYYPGDPTIYFVTGLRPVSKYVYVWPWVAQVAMPDLLAGLSQGEAIVHFDAHMPVAWGYPTSVYLASLQTYVGEHYVPAGDSYVSPALAGYCPPRTQP
jgi:hypothetical protein